MVIFHSYVKLPEGLSSIIVWGSPLSNWALAWRSFLASASRNPLVNLSLHFTFTLLGCSVVVKTCQTKTLWCDYILLTHPHKWCCQRPSAPLGCRFGQKFGTHGRGHNFAKIHCSTNPLSVLRESANGTSKSHFSSHGFPYQNNHWSIITISGWWYTYPSENWWSSSVGKDDIPHMKWKIIKFDGSKAPTRL